MILKQLQYKRCECEIGDNVWLSTIGVVLWLIAPTRSSYPTKTLERRAKFTLRIPNSHEIHTIYHLDLFQPIIRFQFLTRWCQFWSVQSWQILCDIKAYRTKKIAEKCNKRESTVHFERLICLNNFLKSCRWKKFERHILK